eukprot:jgi/Undpi1/3826/HiC_scaffold_16.g07195.m1
MNYEPPLLLLSIALCVSTVRSSSCCSTRLPRPGVDRFPSVHIGQPDDEPDANPKLVDAIASLADGLANAKGLFHGAVGGSSEADGVEILFMEQRLDHFDRQETRTFPQRYFINRKYWAGPNSGAPVFVCVGGEDPFDPTVVSESDYCNDMVELAPQHKVGCGTLSRRPRSQSVRLRHRGIDVCYLTRTPCAVRACATQDWATESLRWLSSQQALADLSSFHGYLSDKEGLTGAEKWVTWGGSYPGMLAGWARLKYPHLFHAAVASAAPLQAQLNFPQYHDIWRDALACESDGVGGSEECAVAVETGARGQATIDRHGPGRACREAPAGRSWVIFDLCDASCLEAESQRISFAGNGVIPMIIEDVDPVSKSPLHNIGALCDIVTDARRGSEARFSFWIFPPLRSPRNGATSLRRPAPPAEALGVGDWALDPSNPLRAWLYQACTEFGYYETCEVGTRCPFVQGLHTLDVDLQLCQKAFGIPPDQVREQIRLTNLYYGGDRPRGSRVIFLNGEIDPWHALGVLETLMPALPAYYIKGASHHFWTHPSKPTDLPDIIKAREIIWTQVTAWLNEED